MREREGEGGGREGEREREVPITVAQRVVIKFLTNENLWPNEIWRTLRAQYRDSTLSKTQEKFRHKSIV
jgi:hypothetical protein